ncbi:alkaline phosphatase PhoX, partial [Pantoea agglomerans]|uniref:alkaline phosphatase PhoX n=1 Tax=Enterobacter agglomerans TaxID=549 RepID=UPI001F5C3B21
YIYKFVSDDKVTPDDAKANHGLLDKGTLYVAQFNGDAQGTSIDVIPVDYCAEALVLLLDAEEVINEVIHISAGTQSSVTFA